jgi:hypothetical protein
MYNQHTRGIMTAGHRDLDERGGKTLLETSRTHIHTHTKKKLMEKTDLRESKKEIAVYRVSSIATRPFFLSNKSNINQYMYIDVSTMCPGVSWPPLSTIGTLFLR